MTNPNTQVQHERISGPTGAIEAIVLDSDSGRWIVLSHPHPLYGGNMYDFVIEHLHDTFASNDFGTVRFNFRGTGASEGQHHGSEEVNDLAAVVAWLRANRSVDSLWLGGYSFGGMTTLNARLTDISNQILVAPVTSRETTLPAHRTHIIVGEDDEFVDLQKLREWHEEIDHVNLTTLPNCPHFFMADIDSVVCWANEVIRIETSFTT